MLWFSTKALGCCCTICFSAAILHCLGNPSVLPVIMMTSSNENIFLVTGPLCGVFTGHRWMLCTKASDAEFWYFFNLCLNKRLSKQSSGWCSETPPRTLWHHCNDSHDKMLHLRILLGHQNTCSTYSLNGLHLCFFLKLLLSSALIYSCYSLK